MRFFQIVLIGLPLVLVNGCSQQRSEPSNIHLNAKQRAKKNKKTDKLLGRNQKRFRELVKFDKKHQELMATITREIGEYASSLLPKTDSLPANISQQEYLKLVQSTINDAHSQVQEEIEKIHKVHQKEMDSIVKEILIEAQKIMRSKASRDQLAHQAVPLPYFVVYMKEIDSKLNENIDYFISIGKNKALTDLLDLFKRISHIIEYSPAYQKEMYAYKRLITIWPDYEI